jgi:hypothetical protein
MGCHSRRPQPSRPPHACCKAYFGSASASAPKASTGITKASFVPGVSISAHSTTARVTGANRVRLIDASIAARDINSHREIWSDRSLLAEITGNCSQSAVRDDVHHGMSENNAAIQVTSTSLASARGDAVATVVGSGQVSPQTVPAHAVYRERRCASTRGGCDWMRCSRPGLDTCPARRSAPQQSARVLMTTRRTSSTCADQNVPAVLCETGRDGRR